MMAAASPALSIAEILKATDGTLVRGSGAHAVQGITTDSRTMAAGNLFVALLGERFDGHAYLDQAVEKGAGGLLVQQDDGRERGIIPIMLVKDTLAALGDLARAWRRRFSPTVMAITGSSGKTTTKEMAVSILKQRRNVLHTRGNYNNLIGLPLTLFGLEAQHEAVILELGTNRPGEIARLTRIAEPDIAVITNIGPAHLEGFGSLAGVAREKGDVFGHLTPGCTVVLNADDEHIRKFEIDESLRRVTFGFQTEADVSASQIREAGSAGIRFILKVGKATCGINLPVLGRHNIANALAAAALAWAAGSVIDEIRQGLESFKPVSGRMEIIHLRNGAFVMDDTYNANPASVGEALHTLCAVKGGGQGIAILGDMLELGAEAEVRHRDIGSLLADTGVKWVYLRGRLSQATAAGALHQGMPEERIRHFTNPAEIMDHLLAHVNPGDWILVKGSRGMKMEEVVDGLAAAMGKKDGETSRPSEVQI